MAYEIYYDGGQVYFSERPEPGGDRSGWGVLVVVQDDASVGKQHVTGTDYMIWRDDHWVGVDLVGLIDHVVNVLQVALVGRMVSSEEYKAIMDRSGIEREKTGWTVFERRP
jgi:hypothetical protein